MTAARSAISGILQPVAGLVPARAFGDVTMRTWSGAIAIAPTFALFVISIVVPVLTGCAAPGARLVQWTDESAVWPEPPERPRVRFLGQIHGELGRSGGAALARSLQEVVYGPARKQRLIAPQAVTIDGSGTRVAVADPNAGGVHILNLEHKDYVFIGHHSTEEALIAQPVALTWSDATLFILEAQERRITAFRDGAVVRSFGKDVLTRPAGLVFNQRRESLYVSDAAEHRICEFHLDGRLIGCFGQRGARPGEFNFPTHLASTPDGDLVVADTLNFRVQRLSPDGTPIRVFGQKGDAGGDFALPKGVAVDHDGNIWAVDAQFENIQAFNGEGRLLMVLGREGHEPGEFWLPNGLAIDGKNRMWVADTYNRRVQIFELLR